VANARHSSDEDEIMRVTCYLLGVLSLAIWVGLLLYTILP
jgi:hypothetical protein